MECARRVRLHDLERPPEVVSILVFMECARRDGQASRHAGTNRVSILVFMECARREPRKISEWQLHVGFNPCFYGMCS